MDIQLATENDIEALSSLYAAGPEDLEGLRSFWQKWFTEIPGEKLTLVATQGRFLGAVRLWKSPYCNDKWLVEGLEVAREHRRQGIGETLVCRGIEILKQRSDWLYAHIHNANIASINLHVKLGFIPLYQGYLNSWGEPRSNGREYGLKLSSYC